MQRENRTGGTLVRFSPDILKLDVVIYCTAYTLGPR